MSKCQTGARTGSVTLLWVPGQAREILWKWVCLSCAWKGQLYLDRIIIEQTEVSCFLPSNWQMKPQRKPRDCAFGLSVQKCPCAPGAPLVRVWDCEALTSGKLAARPSDVSLPSPPSSSSPVQSPRSLLLEAHLLRKIGPSQHPPPLVTRVRPSDLLLCL